MPPETPPPAPQVIRLLCRYDATGVRVTTRVRLQKGVLPGDDLRFGPAPGALTVELRTAAGEVVYRRVEPHTLTAGVEFLDGSASPARVADTRPAGAFSLLLPADPTARDVVLLATPESLPAVLAGRVGLGPGVGELARFGLHPEPVG